MKVDGAPVGWAECYLGELGNWKGGGTPSKENASYWTGGTIPWVSSKDMKTTFLFDAEDKITKKAVAESATNLIPANSILFVMRSGILKHTLPIALTQAEVTINQDLKALTPSNNLFPRGILFLLKGAAQEIRRECMKSGTTVESIEFAELKKFKLPLPPLAEQHRIVAKLDSILPRVEKVRERLEKIPALVKRFRQSVLTAAVTGKLTEGWREKNPGAGEWKESTIGDCIEGLSQGWSPQCENESTSSPEIWAVIKTTAIQHMCFLPDENKRLPTALPPKKEHEIRNGDLIITRAGPRIRAGVCCLVRNSRPRLLLCDKAYRFRPKADCAMPNYLEIFLNAPTTLETIDRMKTGISDSGVNLTQSGFQSISLVLPSIQEQQEIVRQVDKLFALADKLEAHYHRAMARVEKFPQAILAKAFRGELVPQDPNDEPAEKLLERIRQERAGMESNGRAKKKKPSEKPKRAKAKAMA